MTEAPDPTPEVRRPTPDIRRPRSDARGRRSILPALLLLLVVGYVTWDQVEMRALARDIDAIAARGEPVTVVDYAPGADTPERHDAARAYAAAAERARAMPTELTFRLPRLDVDATGGPAFDLTELETTYRADAPALQLLDQATALDFNGFGDLTQSVPDGGLSTLSYLAGLRADLLSARGRTDAAAEALVPSARLLRTVTGMTRYLAANRLLGSLRILLRHGSPEAARLEQLQRALAELPDEDAIARDVGLRRGAFIDSLNNQRLTVGEAIAGRVLRPWITRKQRAALASFDEALLIAREGWPRKQVRANGLEQDYVNAYRSRRLRFFDRLVPFERYGVLSMPSISQTGRDLAIRRVALVTLAVERYRRAHGEALPASLTALVPQYLAAIPVDPFSGDPVIYLPTQERYLVYSVDTNMKNDRGQIYGFGSKGPAQARLREGFDLGIAVDLRH